MRIGDEQGMAGDVTGRGHKWVRMGLDEMVKEVGVEMGVKGIIGFCAIGVTMPFSWRPRQWCRWVSHLVSVKY
jgi:hypothetical protein